MYGPTIIGFGQCTYTYDSGHSGDMPVTGFSPRGSNLVIYSGAYPEQPEAAAILQDARQAQGRARAASTSTSSPMWT